MNIKLAIKDASVSVLLLNNLHGINQDTFEIDWNRANKRYCADGALSLLKRLHVDKQPDYLIGDLDSVDPQDLRDFESKGHGEIIRVSSQDTTDFEKCMSVVNADTRDHANMEWLLVYGGLGGERLDHSVAAFHAILAYPDMRVKLLTDKAVAFVVPVGENTIMTDDDFMGKKCGLFPMAGPSVVSTTGFRWDIEQTCLQYGKFISTSNETNLRLIKISCQNNPIIMTIQT